MEKTLDSVEHRKLPRKRIAFTDQQLDHLENAFQKCHYPETNARIKLALETQLPEPRIQVSWPLFIILL